MVSQAVILAGGHGSHLYPLNVATPKCLLPVANRPLLTFPLRMLEEGGITDVLVVCEGDGAAIAVKSWISQYKGQLRVEVTRVSVGLPSVAALRQVMDKIHTDNFVLLSGDVVTEAPLRAQILTHHLKGAAVTALFGRRKSSAAADTQPGKAPRNVDYVGLAHGDRLVFFNHSPEVQKELHLPAAVARQHSNLQITTNLIDMQVYVFNTAILQAVLDVRSDVQKLEQDLLPYFVKHQRRPPTEVVANLKNNSNSGDLPGLTARMSAVSLTGMSESDTPGGMSTSWPIAHGSKEWYCAAYLVPESSYCQRANTLQGYADVNRDVVIPTYAAKLLKEQPNARYDNYVAGSAVTGAKTTVGSACMVGDNTIIGDKTSVKRSIIGRDCQIGNGVKVINSVLHDGVIIADGCHIQNSILCNECKVNEGVQLKDCQVGPAFVVAGDTDYKGGTVKYNLANDYKNDTTYDCVREITDLEEAKKQIKRHRGARD